MDAWSQTRYVTRLHYTQIKLAGQLGLEPRTRVLETHVLPITPLTLKLGAGKEARTPDIFLGKEVLYQLSYTRIKNLFYYYTNI